MSKRGYGRHFCVRKLCFKGVTLETDPFLTSATIIIHVDLDTKNTD